MAELVSEVTGEKYIDQDKNEEEPEKICTTCFNLANQIDFFSKHLEEAKAKLIALSQGPQLLKKHKLSEKPSSENTVKPEKPRPVSCPQCDATFIQESHMQRHLQTCKKPWTCPTCKQVFERPEGKTNIW